MSTDLELPHEFPNTRIPTIKSTLTSTTATTASSTSRSPHHHDDDKLIIKVDSHVENNDSANKNNKDDDVDDDDDVEKCRTPTSAENRIPEMRNCPPAPRKPRRAASSMACKRKLMNEFQFFEILNRDEVDAFFGSIFSGKRSCRRCKSKQ